MNTLISKRPLISFFFLAYVLSWVIWVPLIFIKGLDPDLTMLIMLIGVLGPAGAAIIVSGVTGTRKSFWRRTFRWKVGIVWHVAALGIPLLVLAIVLIINRFLGIPAGDNGAIQTIEAGPWYTYPLVLLLMIFAGGGLEEPGWRGFAQERMLSRFSPLTASIILGIIWTFWHAPLFFVPGSSQQGMQIGWYTGSVIGISITLTWLFIKSRGSAFLAIIFHGGINAINSWIPSFRIEIGNFVLSAFAVLELVNMAVAAVIIVTNLKLFVRLLSKGEYVSD
jgi:uncharacterized protein